MARQADTQRVLRTLQETDGMSNARARSELDLSNTRYQDVRSQLLDDALIETYRCRGGGIRLTRKGEREIKPRPELKSAVRGEKNLYAPLCDFLTDQADEDDVASVVVETAGLRANGKWQNPDVTQVTIENYEYLGRNEIVVTTYEVKQWGRWDISVVFEAASHKRFSHKAIVVLEWAKGAEFSLSDRAYKLDEISRECQRFGVGLSTLMPYYTSFRLHNHIEPEAHTPADAAVEQWLEYMFERKNQAKEAYLKLLREGITSGGVAN